jgi:type I restriction enzyme S subunit
MIPEGWKPVHLEEIASRIGDGIHATPSYDDDGVHFFINGNNIRDGSVAISENTKKVSLSEFEKYRLKLDRNTILMSINGTIGNLAMYRDEPVILGKSAAYIRLKDNVCKNFIFHVLASDKTQRYFESELTGTTIRNLSLRTIRGTPILLPELPEQRQISALLETWERAIETVEALIANARAQKQALMQQLLPHGTTPPRERLPGFSGEWREQRLGLLADISKGEQKGRAGLADEGPVPVINGGITPSGYTDHPNTAANTITISEGGNSCGHVDLITQPFWCGGHCYALKNLKVDRDFLFAVLKHRQLEIMSLRVGSGLPNIQKKALSQFAVSVPPRSEQVKIGELAAAADREIVANEAQLTALRQEKAALMQQLLTGKRRVKLPESEVA